MGLYSCADGEEFNGSPLYKKERTSQRGSYYYLYQHSQSRKVR